MIHENSTQSLAEMADVLAGLDDRIIWAITGGALTDRQIQRKLGFAEKNHVSPNITRLVQRNVLQESGKVRCDVTGKLVRTLKIAQHAIAA